MSLCVLLVGAGTAVIVGNDGTLTWRLVRVLATVLCVVVLLRAVRRADRRRPLAVLGLGMVAVPVGVGIGGPHVAKTGSTVVGLAGLAVLLGGLGLLVGGAGVLVRTLRLRAAIPTMAAAVLVLGVLLWTLGQATAATNVPRTALGRTTPADHGLAYEDVEFDARDGITLSGWYVPSQNGAAVVLLHGAGSTRSGVLDEAVVLARHGYGILLYDARGHGRSDGRAMAFGWYGDADIAGALAFLQTHPDIDDNRIAAVGMSMGGEQAIGAAAGVDGLAAVVAEGATNRVAGDKGWLSDEFGFRGWLTEGVERLTYGLTDILTDASPPITLRGAALSSAVPMLLIAGGEVPAEVSAGRYIRAEAPRVELWVVPGAGHTEGLQTAPREWEERVVAFLEGVLGRSTGPAEGSSVP
jgi:pimeloyl-ACP methyl ester carboxylesterase